MADPLISPRQMTFLRALAAMAWADGVLEPLEIATMTDQLVALFSQEGSNTAALRQQIQEFVTQHIPIAETLPRIQGPEDRELLLKLAYLVIHSSRRTPEEPLMNAEEARAYAFLVAAVGLPPEVVERVEREALANLNLLAYRAEVAAL